eukprot:gene18561-32744_t
MRRRAPMRSPTARAAAGLADATRTGVWAMIDGVVINFSSMIVGVVTGAKN